MRKQKKTFRRMRSFALLELFNGRRAADIFQLNIKEDNNYGLFKLNIPAR